MSECPRAGRIFGGCKFRPRYDTVSATNPTGEVAFWTMGRELPAPPTPARKTYIADVCERCGKTLARRRTTASGEMPRQRHNGLT